MPPSLVSSISALALLGVSIAAKQPQSSEPQYAETSADIVVVGHRPPRCRPRAGDPQNAVDMSAANSGHSQMIRQDQMTGQYALVADDYPETGPEVWQRAGRRMDKFLFRTPSAGDTVCIGARDSQVSGEAQLRRAFAAKPYWGKYMVLSAFVAARDAGRVDMWIAGGAYDPRPQSDSTIGRDVVAGGFRQVPITGNYTWRQVNLLVGPIPCMAAQISYGVQLEGGGDVWLAKSAFVEVPEDRLSPSMQQQPHGAALLEHNPICQHYRQGRRLWAYDRKKRKVRLAGEGDVVPNQALFDKVDDHFDDGSPGTYQSGGENFRPIPQSAKIALGVVEF